MLATVLYSKKNFLCLDPARLPETKMSVVACARGNPFSATRNRRVRNTIPAISHCFQHLFPSTFINFRLVVVLVAFLSHHHLIPSLIDLTCRHPPTHVHAHILFLFSEHALTLCILASNPSPVLSVLLRLLLVRLRSAFPFYCLIGYPFHCQTRKPLPGFHGWSLISFFLWRRPCS